MGVVRRYLQARRALRVLIKARAVLEGFTPLKTNCGKLCGAACCQSDETGDNGMPLFPFEDRLYQRPVDDFPFRLLPDDSFGKGGLRLVCEGICPRERRPLLCRLFPLRIRVDRGAETTRAVAELDPRAWAVCPLPEMGGLRAMDPRFVAAVEKAGQALIQNPHILAALENEQRLLDQARSLIL